MQKYIMVKATEEYRNEVRKMTDEQIIKALECCSEPAGKCCCEECPLHHREDSCTTALIKMTVGLVNRQKAEIEKQRTSILGFFVHKLKWDITYHKKGEKFSVKMCKDIIDKLLKEMEETT